MTIGRGLLATLDTESSTWAASGYMLVLGLGLGMVMQVLVLAVQNAVDYGDLGVATSGTTLFRSTGGSVGVRSEEHTSELQSLMRISYAVFCLKKKKQLKR